MKTNIIKSILVIFILSGAHLSLLSQEKKNTRVEIPAAVKTDKSVLNLQQSQLPPSKEETDFQNKMKSAKQSGNRTEMLKLRDESDRINGTHTDFPEKLDVKKLNYDEEDNIVMHSITNSASRIIMTLATCTEQSGNNIGRIWTVFSFYPNSPPFFADGIGVSYSDDNGDTWNNYGIYSFGGGLYIYDSDQLDAELIISSSNEKYLWVVFKADINLSNVIKPGLFILNLNNGSYSGSYLNWPGGANVYYKTPRIVSDNSQYSDLAFTYIVASIDSSNTPDPITSPGIFGEKVAMCYDPYTINPVITYRGRSLMRTLTGYLHHPVEEHFNCDIAYYRNGGQDSILIIETGLESSSSLALGRTSPATFLNGNPYLTYQGTINVNSNKRSRGFLASNGAYNQLMISVKYEYSTNDNDIEYYRSTNGSEGWLRGFIDDYTSDATGDADIVGERNNPGKFAVAFNTMYPSRLNYYQSDNYTWSSVSINNFSHMKSSWRSPKAGIRLNSGSDNCFAIWADTTAHGLWSSAGCSGQILSYAKLKLASAIEALYIPEEIIIPDTVRVYLRNNYAPYDIADSCIGILNNYFTSDFIFSYAPYNTPLYIQIKHRNALETWSAGTISITAYETFYNFLIQSNSLGNNTTKVDSLNYIGEMYGFYSGDVNQDGVIDGTDTQLIDNDAFNFSTGYIVTDLNGDEIIDGSDALFAANNAANFVSAVTP